MGRLLSELGVLPNTAMVIRRDELLTDGEMVEDDDEIEIRAVISGGSTAAQRPRGRPTEHGRAAAARTGAKGGFARANPRPT